MNPSRRWSAPLRRLASVLVLAGAAAGLAAEGPRVLFNGRDLTGWDGNPALWSVQAGVIVGRTSSEKDLKYNQFLVWRGGEVKNFELRAKVRQLGNNTGIQYRSRDFPDAGPWSMTGYQLDIYPLPANNGQLYEERGRRLMGRNGHRVVVDPAGVKWLVAATGPVPADANAWNEYTIIARGNHITHQINDRTVFELTDCDEAGRALSGLVGFQIHRGPPMTVEIKDVTLTVLPDSPLIPFAPALVPPGTGQVPMPRQP